MRTVTPPQTTSSFALGFAEVLSKTSIRLFRSIRHLRLGGCQLGSVAHLSKNSVPSYAHFVTHNRMRLKAIGLFFGGGTLRLAAISLGSPTSRFFSALERRQLVIRSHDETLSVAAGARQQSRPSERRSLRFQKCS